MRFCFTAVVKLLWPAAALRVDLGSDLDLGGLGALGVFSHFGVLGVSGIFAARGFSVPRY